ncbi:MAG: hypothetical protein R3335_14830, partial [Anaerolineales bacterium]|nr:hypothetical protein [Anaerolineales bacterium]
MDTKVVLGAGPLGTRLAELLRERGDRVRLYSVLENRAYDMPGTSPDHIDGRSQEALRSALEGAGTVFLCLNAHYVDWEPLFPPVQEAVIEVAAEADAKIISTDPVYVYGKASGPINESLPMTAKDPAIGRLRADLAESLLAAHQAG